MTNKKGLSPVIATTLLVLVAVILAVIIFVWVKNFIGEQIKKDIGGGEEPIANFCELVNFNADVSNDGKIIIQNNGDIPIYGVEIKKKGIASVTSIGAGYYFSSIKSGDTQELSTQYTYGSSTLSSGDTIELIPILLGQGDSERKAYACSDKYSYETEVL